jgi:glutaconyl-CoA/methylmalonyl-CoA decarboxylase subunit delta
MKRLLKLFTPQRPEGPVMNKMPKAQLVAAETATAPGIDPKTLVLIAAALSAYGHSQSRIVAIRTLRNEIWTQAGRVETVQNRNRMYY